jgi:AcrR family transcriptional regulator
VYRDLVLEAAGTAFARSGVARTRMEHLADEAGISLGTLYTVYKGKAEIVDALHESRLEQIHAASMAAAEAERNPLAALLAASCAYISYFTEHPDYLRMVIDEGPNWGVRDSIDRESRRAATWTDGVAQLASLFEQGIAAGVFVRGRADRMARMMLAMQQVRLADWLLEEDEQIDPRVVMNEVDVLIRRAFCTPAWRDR